MKIFVTGGSGFLGGHLIKRLVHDGHQVWALARGQNAAHKVSRLGAIPVIGGLENMTWERALNGMDAIIHAAAIVEYWGPWEKFQKTVIEGTRKLLEAAENCGVKRLIHVSSESVVMSGRPLVDINEDYPIPNRARGLYAESKRQTELVVRNFSGKLERIIIRPSFIYGSGCPSYEDILQKVKDKQFIWVNKGRAPFEAVHVDNVVEALVLALTRGESGDIYFVTDPHKESTHAFFSRLIENLGEKVPTKSVPAPLAMGAAKVLNSIWTKLKIKKAPPLLPFEVDFVSLPRSYSTKKIEDKLGWKPRPDTVKSRKLEGLEEV